MPTGLQGTASKSTRLWELQWRKEDPWLYNDENLVNDPTRELPVQVSGTIFSSDNWEILIISKVGMSLGTYVNKLTLSE